MAEKILAPLWAILIGLVGIWVVFYAIAAMFRQHTEFAAWSKKNLSAFFNWLWKHYHQFLVGFVAGIIVFAAYLHYLCCLI